ncbi:MAG: type I 3-dehydroquinate dehydratase, partial [Blautia sp.]|nr:type I 3-dehydroquinate dehydratase [Blautia sp.]
VPIIAMAMGEMGQESRIYGERYGSCLTFGTVGASSAPGQLPVGELKEKLSQVHRSLLEENDGAIKG